MSIKEIVDHNIKPHGHQYADRKDNGYRVISPSGIGKFYSNPYEWKVNVIDGTPTFFGNEATVIGSLVHKYIELYRSNKLTKDGKIPSFEIDAILSTTSDYDIQKIYNEYPMMCEAVKDNYLEVYPTEVISEEYLEVDLPNDKILIAGTVDEIDVVNEVITDFKTCSKAPTVKDMANYIYQLSAYKQLIEREYDTNFKKFRVVFIQRPTKTIGARVYVAECDAVDISADILNQAIDIILLTDSKPELLDLIFRDNPLSGFVIPDKDKLDSFCDKYVKNFNLVTQEQSKVNKLKKDIFG